MWNLDIHQDKTDVFDSRLLNGSRSAGFTLIELITVIVILAVLASLGSTFVVSAVKSFYQTQERSKLTNRGRQAIEQMSRQLRSALPNSIRISSNSRCIEFLPVVGAAKYLSDLPDMANGAAAANTISTSPLQTGLLSASYVSVGALAASELYSGASSVSLVALGGVSTSAIPNTLTLASSKRWQRNSSTRRVFLVAKPQQFCMLGNELTLHTNYTSGGYPVDGDLSTAVPNVGDLMADNVSFAGETGFSISNATESRNTLVSIVLPLSNGSGDRVVLRHQVMVRNVP